MNNRILVKVSACESSLAFRTVTKKQKSPHWFYILRSDLERLWRDGSVITSDIHSFARLRCERDKSVVSIYFTWLNAAGGDDLTGWEQTVRLPCDALAEFAARSVTDGGPKQWKALSLAERRTPKLVFCSKENLHAALSSKIVRSKLVRYLRDHFNWFATDEIRFFNDFLPYSFFFQAYQSGCPGICGGLILHDHQDLGRAYYSVHT